MATSLQYLTKELRSFQGRDGPAFIGGRGSNGLSFLRSLGRRGIPVVAMDSWYRSEMLSRYGLPLAVPDPADQEDALLQLLSEIGSIGSSPGKAFAVGLISRGTIRCPRGLASRQSFSTNYQNSDLAVG